MPRHSRSEKDKQTVSATVSSDFASRVAWGVACSYKLGALELSLEILTCILTSASRKLSKS